MDSEGTVGAEALRSEVLDLTGFFPRALNVAVGGSGSNENADPNLFWWNLGTDSPGPLLVDAISQIESQLEAGQDVDAIIWAQGEDDARLIESIGDDSDLVAENHEEALLNIFETFRSSFGNDLPIFIQELGAFPEEGGFLNGPIGALDVIRETQQELIDREEKRLSGCNHNRPW